MAVTWGGLSGYTWQQLQLQKWGSPLPGQPFLAAQLGPDARILVEAAWGADVTASSSTWTWYDITADVRQADGHRVDINHGRADETSQAQPASCSFQLDNTAGTYSAYNPASTRYPYVRRGTPIRVSVNPGTGNVVRFFGFADGFTPSWDASAKLAVVTVSASGTLRRLAQGRSPLRSTLYRNVLASNPTVYWPLEEGSTTTQGASALPGGAAMSIGGTLPAVASSGTPAGSAPLVQMASDTSMTAPVPAYPAATAWSGQFVINIPSAPGVVDTPMLDVYLGSGTMARWRLNWTTNSGGGFWFESLTTGGVATNNGPNLIASTFANGTPYGHNIVICFNVWTSGGNIVVDCTYSSPDGAAGLYYVCAQFSTPGTNGNAIRVEVPSGFNRAGWVYGHISLWGKFSEPQSVISARALAGFRGDPAVTRIVRLCAEQGVPLALTLGPEIVYEDFEDSAFNVAVSGDWARDNTQSYTGKWALRSKAIADNGTTDAVVNVPSGATLMVFWYRVSSEAGHDLFRLLFDGNQRAQSSGEVGWTRIQFDVTGVNQVTFRYTKDASGSAGADAVWIDNLFFMTSNATRMGPQGVDTFVNLLRECETTDPGVLYDGFTAGLGYLTNSSRYNQPAALTLDMSAGQVSPPFAPVDDDQRNCNRVTATRRSGSSATYEDASGPLGTAAIGTYDTSLTINTISDDLLTHRASWEVHKGTVEGLRYPNLNLDMAANPSLVPAWLGTTLAERIDVTNVSSVATQHPPDTVSLLLEGYTETLSPFGWSMSCNCSPYAPYRVLKLDDVPLGRLNTDGSTLAASASSGATSLSVQNNGTPWRTTGVFPIDVEIGGIRVTVSAISGTSTPQTFTVTGVTKALAANTRVRLWRPTVPAL